jgi:hypothetical protein
MDPLDRLVRSSSAPESVYWRALCRAYLGGADGVHEDSALYAKNPCETVRASANYRFAMRTFEATVSGPMGKVSDLIQLVSVHPSAPETSQQVDQHLRQCDACIAFLSQFPCPPAFKNSHGERLMALKLLKITLLDLQEFATSSSEDVLTDARINLGEALKESKAAETHFASEQSDASHGSNGMATNP